MAFMDWNSRLETGFPEIDRQHQRLVELLNQLHEAMKMGKGMNQADAILKGLVDYTNKHFKDEEELMRSRGYAALATHQILHQKLLKQLGQLIEEYQSKQQVSTLPLSDFLKDWLVNHIMQEDQKYATALGGLRAS